MAKDNLTEGLEAMEEVAAEKETKAKKEKKEMTPEELEALKAACDKVKAFGVSDNFAKVMELVPVWHDKEASAPIKEAVANAFGGSDKFKDYIDGEFQEELAVINGLNKVASTLNNIKAFYARRESSKKAKTQLVMIGGKYYQVNSEFYASLADKSADEKREALLNHADTKENNSVEVL